MSQTFFLAKVCGHNNQLLADVKILHKSYRSEFLEKPNINLHSKAET
jgi:hypothetical protein